MFRVIVATTNPAKLNAVQRAFSDLFGEESCQITGIHVESGVASQPMGSEETRQGARQRVHNARQASPEADFWVGVEAGIEEGMTFAWVVIENPTRRGESRSASMMLPPCILEGIKQGAELADEMAHLTGIEDIRRKQGAIGVFTQGKLSRSTVYHHALILALVPFINEIY